ncbi:MAG: GNAT family N-acetyltransferase [Acidithiobacillus sp.]
MAEMLPLSFRKAEERDCPDIVRLVNLAYRGELSKQGWTTEADLLAGQRTDGDEALDLLRAKNSLFLLALRGRALLASLHLQRVEGYAYLGMFAVDPRWQGVGIGKCCLQRAENLVREEWGVSVMRMVVITLREELIVFYARRGYQRTGELRPFPRSPRFGIPQVAGLQMEVLEKRLGPLFPSPL